ncbi:MAG: bifunctional hydroxymethylpyrimidine kinase/phosphomethylpyrimidine kinase [Candidatus Geothermarchaeales archaeon]
MKRTNRKVPVALTIAGSDSGGGAGIQADLKTFAAVGVHGATAITSVTAQNTLGVAEIRDLDVALIRKQIDVVVEDLGVDAAKTGMLHTKEIIEAVAEEIKRHGFPTVVDPVMMAKSGAPLLRPEAVESLKGRLLPLASVVTPNRSEAEEISGFKIETLEDAKRAARDIAKLGPEAVVVKGGHIEAPGESVDVLYYKDRVKTYGMPRLDSRLTHGTGCSFSAAITGFLARGFEVSKAVEEAKGIVFYAIKHGFEVGRGYGPVNPLARLYLEGERYAVIVALEEALKKLSSEKRVFFLVPEVRMNLVFALPMADDIGEVAGFPGRITFDGERLVAVSRPKFGTSTHVAKTVITVMERYPQVRSGLSVKYSRDLLDSSLKLGLNVLSYDRRLEPEEVKRTEGASIPWGVEQALKGSTQKPDVIFHLGDIGKEPIITILGDTPMSVVDKVFKIIETQVNEQTPKRV